MPPQTAVVEPSTLLEFERRCALRLSTKRDATTRPLDVEATLGWGATVRNISSAGIGLTLCFPFPAGSYLAVELDFPQAKALASPLLARVVHAQDLPDGTWHLGCEFVKPLSPAELELLL